MKANNILVELTNPNLYDRTKMYKYKIDDYQFTIPHIGIQIKIWDFDFSSIDGIVENSKVNASWTKRINITKKENKYYDINYFFNTLISKRFFPQFYKGGVPPQIVDFVHRVVPPQYRNGSRWVSKKSRLLVNHQNITPYKIIINDPLFAKYRKRIFET